MRRPHEQAGCRRRNGRSQSRESRENTRHYQGPRHHFLQNPTNTRVLPTLNPDILSLLF